MSWMVHDNRKIILNIRMTQKPASLNWLQNKGQPPHMVVCMWTAFLSVQGTFVKQNWKCKHSHIVRVSKVLGTFILRNFRLLMLIGRKSKMSPFNNQIHQSKPEYNFRCRGILPQFQWKLVLKSQFSLYSFSIGLLTYKATNRLKPEQYSSV